MNTLESKISSMNSKVSTLESNSQEINFRLSDPSTLPYQFYQGCAVVYEGQIHLLGGYSDNKAHYKWDGSKWAYVSTLPYSLTRGCAVVYEDQIHILGSSGNPEAHYKWNGSSWVSVSSLPYQFYQGCAVVYSGKIHILGGSAYPNRHYVFDGSSWSGNVNLPVNLYDTDSVVEYRYQLHLLKENRHYKWRYGDWELITTSLPVNFNFIKSVVLGNELHVLGGNSDNNSHYKWDGVRWMNASVLPYYFYEGCAVVHDNRIHLLGGRKPNVTTNNEYKHFII